MQLIFPQEYIFTHKLNIDATTTAELIDAAVESYLCRDYNQPGNNFAITHAVDKFDDLYASFLNICEKTFGPLVLQISNKKTCWGYFSNKFYYLGGIHNHIQTSVINAVYYLQVPVTETLREGSLSFYNKQWQEVYNYKPIAGDLILFPGHVNHQPHQSFTDDFRISINMEIMCKPFDWNCYVC